MSKEAAYLLGRSKHSYINFAVYNNGWCYETNPNFNEFHSKLCYSLLYNVKN